MQYGAHWIWKIKTETKIKMTDLLKFLQLVDMSNFFPKFLFTQGKKKNTKNINWNTSTKGTLVIIAKGTQQVDPLKPNTKLPTQIMIFEEVMKYLIA